MLKWLPFISLSEHSGGISAPLSVGNVHPLPPRFHTLRTES